MAIAVLVFVLLVGPIALLWGRDSRIDDTARRRHYLG
jgi:hypothetical protein